MTENLHIWHHCHNCGAGPIAGKRYHCKSCPAGPDNDLCETCYGLFQKGQISHPAEHSQGAAMGIGDHHFEVEEGKPSTHFQEWKEVPHPQATAPTVPDNSVIRPIFSSGLDSVIAGYSFAVKSETHNQPLLLTALHVMDELIKKKGIDSTANNPNYTGRELPEVVTDVLLYDIFAANRMRAPLGNAGPMLVLPNARTDDEEPHSSRDIAAFKIKDYRQITPLPLAPAPPKKGDPVWLAGQVTGKPGQRTLKAVVLEITQNSMVFAFQNPDEKAPYSSGAPVLNQNGQVVGINVGGGAVNNQNIGHANHVGNIKRHLEESRQLV